MWIGIGNPYPPSSPACWGVHAGHCVPGAAVSRIRPPWSSWRPRRGLPVANAGYAWHHFIADDNRPLLRNYAGSLLYALKPIDWFIPPVDHQFPWAARLGQAYVNQTQVLGEFFAGYLGFVGIAGLIGLVALAVRRLGSRSAGRCLMPPSACCWSWPLPRWRD
jgi:hypothetical protein